MDDLLSGAPTMEEATELQAKIHAALASAQLILRKHKLNSSSLSSKIDRSLVAPHHSLQINEGTNMAVLGLNWDTVSDNIRFRIQKPKQTEKLTKDKLYSKSVKLLTLLA